jgi:hypothetical protein
MLTPKHYQVRLGWQIQYLRSFFVLFFSSGRFPLSENPDFQPHRRLIDGNTP